MCGKTGGSVVIRARTPTQSESALNTVSPGDTVVGESSGTVSTPDTGPLDAVMYGVPVNKAPWVFAKKTSKSTLPPPVTLKSVGSRDGNVVDGRLPEAARQREEPGDRRIHGSDATRKVVRHRAGP